MSSTIDKNSFTIEIIDGKAVRECLTVASCIPLMEKTMVALHRGEVILPQRFSLPLFEGDQQLMIMSGAMKQAQVVGIKALTLYPSNPSKNIPAIQGFISLFDANTGTLMALVDAASITAIRTAAASGVATQYLAKADASCLALIGTGPQAESHFHAMLSVRPIKRVKIWSRNFEKARALAKRICQSSQLSVEAEENIHAAIEDADIICTLTGSSVPLINGQCLKPGAHLNLIGAHSAVTREVDTGTIRRSRVFVEHKSAAFKEAGDLLIPMRENAIQESHVLGELAQVILGDVVGRENDADITCYKSLGNASQDLAAAVTVLFKARNKSRSKVVNYQH